MSLPAPETIYFEIPPYSIIELGEDDNYALVNILTYNKKADAYCIECNNYSIFRVYPSIDMESFNNHYGKFRLQYPKLNKIDYSNSIRYFEHILKCERNPNHHIFIKLIVHNNNLFKIGQYPTMADLIRPEINKYKKILDEKYIELNRAVGLNAHGVGIGAFVYLRRILENLIENAHQKAISNEENWDEENYHKLKMSDKIKELKNYLPEFLYSNSHIYSILSKGIHELKEQECLDYFTTIKNSIELILDQEIQKKEENKKAEQAKKDLNEAIDKIKNHKDK